VIFTRFAPLVGFGSSLRHDQAALPAAGVLFLAAQAAHRSRLTQHLQPGEGGAHHVVRVGRADRLGQHVLDAGRLDDGADRAAGDDARCRPAPA
jgi:hypothetical protein